MYRRDENKNGQSDKMHFIWLVAVAVVAFLNIAFQNYMNTVHCFCFIRYHAETSRQTIYSLYTNNKQLKENMKLKRTEMRATKLKFVEYKY